MKIGIDIRTASRRKTGDRTYTLGLLRGLAAVDELNEYWLLGDAGDSGLPFELPDNFRFHRAPIRSSRLFTLVGLPRAAAELGLDLLHVQYLAPWRAPCAMLTTIHDVSFAAMPETFRWRDRWVLNRCLPATLHRCRAVITGSEFSRREIARWFDVEPDGIHVTPYAATEFPTPSESDDAVLRRLGVPRSYLLSVGVLQPRKNIPLLLKAAAALWREKPDAPPLVVTGKPGWLHSDIPTVVHRLGIAERVVFTGYVADADLPALYRNAVALAYPSVYEGFGLPPLEAMSFGCPVIVSRAASLPEVVGDAGLLLDPHDPSAWTAGLATILEDADLRARLQREGPRRAAEFDWRRTAEQTVEVYRLVEEGAPSLPHR